jgi:XRE family transcriptional regulator, fatty acid utilization regulator
MRNDLFLKQMGGKIKMHRKAKGFPLTKLSELSGVDLSNLWFIEDGKRNVHLLTLKSIADVLEVDVKELL